MHHPIFEESTSPLYASNDGRLHVERVRSTQPEGWAVVDTTDDHVQLFTLKREIADAFIAGYDYRHSIGTLDETAYKATHARVSQLTEDAHERYLVHDADGTRPDLKAYYSGLEDGLKRALRVLEGKG